MEKEGKKGLIIQGVRNVSANIVRSSISDNKMSETNTFATNIFQK